MTHISRRTVLQASTATAGAVALTATANPVHAAASTPTMKVTHGVQSGDVTTTTAVLWARLSRPGFLLARVETPSGVIESYSTRVDESSDFTGKIFLQNLTPGHTYHYEMFGTHDRYSSEGVKGSFTTAPNDRRDVSFVWTGDTCGQGWGRNAATGMLGYKAMHDTNPDFFIHSGDTIYADGPISPEVELPDGSIYRNVVSDGVDKVAESQDEFWGRHRYNVGDVHVQAMNAEVPVIAQWDDHETVNNWYPGEILTDDRYANEKNVDVLAERARKAFTDYFPMDSRIRDEDGNVYGKFARGPHMDVFVIDMRTYRAANSKNLQESETDATLFLGQKQLNWLIRELRASKATWKVIASDMPIGLVVGDGENFENMANADDGAPKGRELEFSRLLSCIKDVKNVVWFTADVHYCAAHYYSPQKASFKDFRPFWEFVAGPINAGTFGPNKLDMTFGPEVVFSETGPRTNASPAEGGQFFGHVDIDGGTGHMTVRLINAKGETRYQRILVPSPTWY